MFVFGLQTEFILDCLLFNCAFSISDVTQSIVFQFVQNLSKTTFLVFRRFSQQTVQILIEYFDNG